MGSMARGVNNRGHNGSLTETAFRLPIRTEFRLPIRDGKEVI
jgi:hypothetical protein